MVGAIIMTQEEIPDLRDLVSDKGTCSFYNLKIWTSVCFIRPFVYHEPFNLKIFLMCLLGLRTSYNKITIFSNVRTLTLKDYTYRFIYKVFNI